MIDTHTHLYMADSFLDGGETAVDRAVEAGVKMMVLPGVDIESVEPMIKLHERRPANTAVALGLHPTDVEADWRRELSDILSVAKDIDTVAIGETGIDLHWEQRYLSRQMDAFGEQLQTALEMNLPVIVHSRDAVEETVEVLKEFGSGLPGLVFHSFTAGPEEMEKLLEAAPDAFFGINGVITFKNAKPLKEAVAAMDPARIVVETDAPFLAPVPYRGSINESAYIPYIIKTISELKGIKEEKLKTITTGNAYRLYPRLSIK